MNDLFLDTQFFIAFASRNDMNHRTARAWADWISRRRPRLHYHDGILLEIGDGFSSHGHAATGRGLVEDLLADPLAVRHPLSPEVINRAFAFQKSHGDKEWGLTDCVSFVVMREHNIPAALTTDRHFQQAGYRALLFEAPPDER